MGAEKLSLFWRGQVQVQRPVWPQPVRQAQPELAPLERQVQPLRLELQG